MIRDRAYWRRWEAEQIAAVPADFFRNAEIYDELYEEARALGVWPEPNLEGLESRFRLARALHALESSGRAGGRS